MTLTVPTPDLSGLVARAVRGHNWGPIKDGWLVYYRPDASPPGEGVDKICVVRTEDERVLLRRVEHGRAPGRYDLFTATGPAELDVDLAWAEEVLWIRPHVLSDGEVAALELLA